MSSTLEVVFAPAEVAALPARDLSQTTCVVFDVFRATSSIVTALAHGAQSIIPVSEIPEALAWRAKHPDVLLAGERHGLRISAELTGGIEFDLGNSPREFTPAKIQGRRIVMSTTNGSRALRASARAKIVLVCSFLNLRATAEFLQKHFSPHILLVCSGTFDEASYEDLLGAGALADLLWPGLENEAKSDSARIAFQIFEKYRNDLPAAVEQCRNGRRLLAIPDLRDDVAWCLQRDIFPFAARLNGDAVVRVTN